MNERDLFLHQIDSLRNDLHTIEIMLDKKEIDQNLRERVRNNFSIKIKNQRIELMEVKKQVGATSPIQNTWDEFSKIRTNCQALFQEYLAFIEGALSRSAGVDNGLCKIADSLLDDLSNRCNIHWDGFTILAEGESFKDMVSIIRLRFPDVTIWNLPIAAHEFGHFVAQELRVKVGRTMTFPFQEMLEDVAGKNSQLKSYLNEYFADLFATYTLGPAYAYTCILQRFDPSTVDGNSHPSTAKRVYFILKTLDIMDKDDFLQPFLSVTAPLNTLWEKSLEMAGQPINLDAATTRQLDGWQAKMYVMLDEYLLNSAKYNTNSWNRAKTLSANLLSNQAPAKLLDDHSLADILNAAWHCGFNQWKKSDQISEQAIELCHEIMKSSK